MVQEHIDNLLVSISRLVVVDSVGVAIAEIDLRYGGILIGGGNIGKTSILNAIRLFLLPEENFKNSAKKFGFSDKEGKFYTDDESFSHYFPSASSFLILECDNYLGGHIPHCQILYRGSADKLDYRRMFTSLRYEQIRHLFWDNNFGNDGIGGKVADLSPTKVISTLKREDRHFKQLVRSSAIKELIYANKLLDVDAMRFCLFPLNKTDDANIDAFRALVRLLFDMKTGSDTVRLAVANIVESLKKERKDELNFDIDAFITNNEALARKERLLNDIASLRPKFEALSDAYQQLKRNTDAQKRLMQFALVAETRLTKDGRELESEGQQLTLIGNKIRAGKADINATKTALQQLKGQSNRAGKEQRKVSELVNKANFIINQYDEEESLDEIITGLIEYKDEKQLKLEQLQNENKRQIRIDELTGLIEQSVQKQHRLQASLQSQETKLRSQLSDDVWQKIAALNLSLAEANPHQLIGADERREIEAFTALMTPVEQGYQVLGATLPYVQVADIDSDKQKLEQVEDILEQLQTERQDLLDMGELSKFSQIKEISQLETEVKRTVKDIDLVKASSYQSERLADLEQELAELELRSQEQTIKHETQQSVLTQQQSDYQVQDDKLNDLRTKLEGLKALSISAKAQLEAYHLPATDFEVLPDHSIELEQAELDVRVASLRQLNQARSDLTEGVRYFVRQQVLENDDQLLSAYVDDTHLSHAFEQLNSRYDGLEQELGILRDNFREHKHSIHAIINELKNNQVLVKQFEQSINRAFEGVVINDLACVEAKIGVEARFSDLVSEIEHLDAHSDQKASDQFIERLKAFSVKFFPDGKAALLTMEQIVAGISYRVKKQGQNGWETKSQSTSTIMLINLKLVEILLSQIRSSACTTHFPLIIDEGASVDSSQFDWLLPNLKEAGFRVLSASTNSASSEIIFKFGHHFKLDSMRTAAPYHPSRTIAYTGMPDSFVEAGCDLDREQLDMFGADDE